MKFKRGQFVMFDMAKVEIEEGNLLYKTFIEENEGKALKIDTTRTRHFNRP